MSNQDQLCTDPIDVQMTMIVDTNLVSDLTCIAADLKTTMPELITTTLKKLVDDHYKTHPRPNWD